MMPASPPDGTALAMAAERLVGAGFRLRGRYREHGLDCLGVLACALRDIGLPGDLPTDYVWRNSNPQCVIELAEHWNFSRASEPVLPGDVVLLRVGPAALHFAIATTGGAFVHAHAGQRKVLLSPALPEGRVIQHWRLDPKI